MFRNRCRCTVLQNTFIWCISLFVQLFHSVLSLIAAHNSKNDTFPCLLVVVTRNIICSEFSSYWLLLVDSDWRIPATGIFSLADETPVAGHNSCCYSNTSFISSSSSHSTCWRLPSEEFDALQASAPSNIHFNVKYLFSQ